MADKVLSIKDGVLEYYSGTKRNFVVPNGVTSIGGFAFSENDYPISITLPDSVTSIEDRAFNECHRLASINIPSSVTRIGPGAFAWSSLASIKLPKSVTEIGAAAFSWCFNLTSITVEEGNPKYHSESNCLIETATNTLIAGCSTSVIPAYVTTIADYAFSGRDLTSIALPHSLTEIGAGAFASCHDLTSITIPDSVTGIGSGAFEACDITSIVVAKGNPKYHSEGNCLIETAPHTLIAGCSESVIPSYVTTIKDGAFSQCFLLTSITIPHSVLRIGTEVFYNCQRLTSINYTGTVAEWNAIEKDCKWISARSVTVVTCSDGSAPIEKASKANDAFCIENGVLKWSYRDEGIVAVPDGVKSIGNYAFRSSKMFPNGITAIMLPPSVTSIGNYAFSECKMLEWIMIPSSVTRIGEGAFNLCDSLDTINYKGSVSEWELIEKGRNWSRRLVRVVCSDGCLE